MFPNVFSGINQNSPALQQFAQLNQGQQSPGMSALQQIGQSFQGLGQLDSQNRQRDHMAKVFAANPDFAAKLYGAQAEMDRNARLQSGGSLPAALQIANEYAKARQSGDIQRMNDIALAAKSFDKGVQFDADGNIIQIGGYAPAVAGIAGAKAGAEQDAKNVSDYNYKPSIQAATTSADIAAKIQGEPALNQANKIATDTGAAKVERQQNYTKAQSALVTLGQQAKIVTDTIDKAFENMGVLDDPLTPQDESKNAPSSLSTGYGTFLADVPDSRAGKLKNYLDTIKANIGFDKLQQMRESSPTGGALGNVSDMENKLLQAVNGALDPKQPEQLVENLKSIKELYPQVLAERQRAFEQDYGATQPFGNNPVNTVNTNLPGSLNADLGNLGFDENGVPLASPSASPSSVPMAPKGGVQVITTQAQYDALPSGATYISPDDGKPHRKP